MQSTDRPNSETNSRLRRIGSLVVGKTRPMDNASLYNGFTNALAAAVEMVLTPAIFFLAGLWLDSAVGTSPIFAVCFAVLAFAGVIAKTYYAYRAAIAVEEAGKPWTR